MVKDLIVSPPQKEHFHQRTLPLPLPPSPPPLLHLYQNHLLKNKKNNSHQVVRMGQMYWQSKFIHFHKHSNVTLHYSDIVIFKPFDLKF